jgi:hypothetical protein
MSLFSFDGVMRKVYQFSVSVTPEDDVLMFDRCVARSECPGRVRVAE